jgi:MFS family permease
MDLQHVYRRMRYRPRQGARLLAYANGTIWGVANGLVTTTLITYLATEYGAKGVAISLILAAPHLVGLLRQSTPRFIARWGSRKWFCIQAYVTSATALLCIPLLEMSGLMPSAGASLVALIALWCLYQLLEYFGTVGLWSWLGDVAPRRTRGRFLGVREAWLSGGRLLGMLASGLFTFYWPTWMSRETLWQAYSICNVLGALTMLVAVVPLLLMPALEDRAKTPAPGALGWRKLFFSPLKDRRFRPMIAYGCWLGTVNGLLGASQFFYSKRVLGLSLLVMLAMRCEIELGQTAISATVGRVIDRLGNRRVMMAAQLLVALSMVFYLSATAERWQLIFGASTLFIAYAGLNVGIPNLVLRLSPTEDRSGYVASYYAWAGLAYGLGSLSGGLLFDWTATLHFPAGIHHFALFFGAGLVLRACGIFWIAAIPEDQVPRDSRL